jgi:hypothetical protein
MSGSYSLYKTLLNPNSVTIDATKPLDISSVYMINGAVRTCHPDFVATPLGKDPNGFLICRRKEQPVPIPIPPMLKEEMYTQSYNLYDNRPQALPKTITQPFNFHDRRLPNQAHLQGADYFRDSIVFRGIGVENTDKMPGQFGYRENKYYFSAPPPRFDITQGIQPYPLWRREQLRMNTLTPEEMIEFEKVHNYVEATSTY